MFGRRGWNLILNTVRAFTLNTVCFFVFRTRTKSANESKEESDNNVNFVTSLQVLSRVNDDERQLLMRSGKKIV